MFIGDAIIAAKGGYASRRGNLSRRARLDENTGDIMMDETHKFCLCKSDLGFDWFVPNEYEVRLDTLVMAICGLSVRHNLNEVYLRGLIDEFVKWVENHE